MLRRPRPPLPRRRPRDKRLPRPPRGWAAPLSGRTGGDKLTLPYELQARYVVRAQTPSGEAYNYYAPDQTAITAPQRIVVTLATP